jgi:Rieske Fe-S protein
MQRRDFLKTGCVLAIATNVGLLNNLFAGEVNITKFNRTLLTTDGMTPLRLKDIQNDVPYIFFYPYRATPVYLLKLDLPVKEQKLSTSTGDSYKSPSGVSKTLNLVAYTAICPHQLMYPTKDYTVVNFYGKNDDKCVSGVQLIKCCAHMSIYDPKNGGKKVDGPTENHLTAIVLEYDEAKDEIYAVGAVGRFVFDDFFDAFKKELKDEYGSTKKARELVSTAPTIRLSEYAKELIRC